MLDKLVKQFEKILKKWENFRNSESYVEEDKSLKEKADYERLLNRNKFSPRKGCDGFYKRE